MEAQEDALKIALGWEWRVFSLGLGRWVSHCSQRREVLRAPQSPLHCLKWGFMCVPQIIFYSYGLATSSDDLGGGSGHLLLVCTLAFTKGNFKDSGVSDRLIPFFSHLGITGGRCRFPCGVLVSMPVSAQWRLFLFSSGAWPGIWLNCKHLKCWFKSSPLLWTLWSS